MLIRESVVRSLVRNALMKSYFRSRLDEDASGRSDMTPNELKRDNPVEFETYAAHGDRNFFFPPDSANPYNKSENVPKLKKMLALINKVLKLGKPPLYPTDVYDESTQDCVVAFVDKKASDIEAESGLPAIIKNGAVDWYILSAGGGAKYDGRKADFLATKRTAHVDEHLFKYIEKVYNDLKKKNPDVEAIVGLQIEDEDDDESALTQTDLTKKIQKIVGDEPATGKWSKDSDVTLYSWIREKINNKNIAITGVEKSVFLNPRGWKWSLIAPKITNINKKDVKYTPDTKGLLSFLNDLMGIPKEIYKNDN